MEQSGHTGEAVATYRKWLAANPTGPKWDKTFLHMTDLINDPNEAVSTILNGLPKLTTDSARHDAYVRVGELDKLTGNWSDAQESYENASLVPGRKDYSSLLESARLLIQLGRLAEADGQIRSIIEVCQDPKTVTEARVLSVKLAALTGKEREATTQIAQLLSNSDPSHLSPRSLAELYEVADRLDLKNDRATIAGMLAKYYPASPEESIVRGDASRFPSPAILLGFNAGPYEARSNQITPSSQAKPEPARATGTPAEPAGSKPTAPSGTASNATVSIQIGSYRDRSNAEYRLKDLQGAGFDGKIREATVDGTTYYKVLVPQVPLSKSQDYLTKLKERGFEGFLLYD